MKNVRSIVRRFHEDEEGMEAIQVVAIFAIAAVVLIFVKQVIWPKVQAYVNKETTELTK